jgi:hypothetical protein
LPGAEPMIIDQDTTVAIPARLRGRGPGLPRRFRAGELHVGDAGLIWYARRGRLGVALDRSLIHLDEIRPARRGDGRWSGDAGRVVVLDYLSALIELAVGARELSIVRIALRGDGSRPAPHRGD